MESDIEQEIRVMNQGLKAKTPRWFPILWGEKRQAVLPSIFTTTHAKGMSLHLTGIVVTVSYKKRIVK